MADGYAMAWRVPAGCREAEARFAPDRLVLAGYAISAPALLALLAFLVLRRRPRAADPEPEPLPAPAAFPRLPVAHAALLAASPRAIVLGGVVAARAAPAIGRWSRSRCCGAASGDAAG